jgi:uncharacterized membrane protein
VTKPNVERGLNLERTVFFSDAVIAIAMTLLAIELPLPQGDTTSAVWHSFLDNLGGEYLAFLISFAVIGAFWYQHHRFFDRVERISTGLIVWNLVSLLAIVLIPFATKMLSAEAVGLHGEADNGYALGPVLYSLVMLLWGAAYVMMVRLASKNGLWRADTPATAPGNMIFGAASALAMFAVSIPIAFASPGLAQLSWLLIPVFARVGPMIRKRLLARGLSQEGS